MSECPPTCRDFPRAPSRSPRANKVVVPPAHTILVVCIVLLTMTPLMAAEDEASQRLESFDMVWRTVKDAYFDRTFGGFDWHDSGRRHRDEIISSEGVEAFVRITNRMLFELGVSHLLVTTPEELGRYMPRLFASGAVGIDVRWMQGAAVVTAVKSGLPAWNAGIRPGHLVTAIDARRVEEIIADAVTLPPFNERNLRGGLSNYLLGHIDGAADTSVTVTWLDTNESFREAVLTRKSRGVGTVLDEAMPPAFIDFEARRLEGDIGYVWFNHFADPVEKAFPAALDDMSDTKGLIIDLRGNPGGYFPVIDAIASRLLPAGVPLYRFNFRGERIERVSAGATNVYRQPVVVLVDVTSTSSSELFTGILQTVGRAVVLGERSPGYLLGARWMKLPNGVSFMFPFTEPIPVGGHRIEDVGVEPDIVVALDRDRMLHGEDNQLQAAIAHIRGVSKQATAPQLVCSATKESLLLAGRVLAIDSGCFAFQHGLKPPTATPVSGPDHLDVSGY